MTGDYKCFDVDGTPLVLWACSGTTNQNWSLR
ncbi:hypothetical protein J2S69_001194 [Glycomyces lechevalierae]|uniref:Ricin B lectin domain-containing protein n=1 Tax=Glycomyces lechevalierae TaxID=256034 RepID=A0ABU2AKF7_9ACTN|nr:hypothetical protein [Glycomyces lechevalierae]